MITISYVNLLFSTFFGSLIGVVIGKLVVTVFREKLKKAEIIEERLGNGDWVQVLLILERNIEEHGRSTKHLSEFEKALIKSASFFFSDFLILIAISFSRIQDG